MRYRLGATLAFSARAAIFSIAGSLDNHGSCPSPIYRDCCSALSQAGLTDKLAYPGQEIYEDSVNTYWTVIARLQPTCILRPTTAKDVSLAVKTLVETEPSGACTFAVRGGGHTPWAGAANIENGITIDLSLMNSTTYNAECSTVSIGAGARWDSVYRTLDKIGVATAGGRTAKVGVGGLTLGGGNTFYAARYGFVCDNVVNFELVLANGDIVYANAGTNRDLFQALKGGSNNFGIVTRFDLYAFKAEGLWGGIVVYPADTAQQHISAFVNFNDRIKDDPYASAIDIWQYSSQTGKSLIMNCYEYTKPVAAAPIFEEYLKIRRNMSDSMRITDMTSLSEELEQPEGLRNMFWTLTFQNDERVIQKMVELHDDLSKKLGQSSSTFAISNMIQPIPALLANRSMEKGGNVLGLDRFKENLVLFQHYLTWDREDEDDVFQSAGNWFIRELSDFAKKVCKDNEFIYLDYAYKTQNPLASYGKENIEKIRAVAKKYDPDGVFQRMVPGGFKISDVRA